ncbi:hypothetical protein AVEN_36259-1 [Araneus ventricosus]|uniref:Uncharacterized protein n=1 Tax=Araneus ventricosus TaxID=182803 RepID=A0A4Y2P208_ARAVE|nr:hypothetical protein AVEN_36259-1 [Araneus ventricosus]
MFEKADIPNFRIRHLRFCCNGCSTAFIYIKYRDVIYIPRVWDSHRERLGCTESLTTHRSLDMRLVKVSPRINLSTYSNKVANSPNALPYLDPRPADLAPAPSYNVFDIAKYAGRRPATWAAAPAVTLAAPAVSRAAIPANAAVPAFRYIPGHPYGNPVIYGYSSGAYTYYSPSVLSPYSYGSYGSYGSYHSEPYGYLYKK